MDRKVEAAIPAPPNVDSRINPSEEQLAHVLESTLTVEPGKKDARFFSKTERPVTNNPFGKKSCGSLGAIPHKLVLV